MPSNASLNRRLASLRKEVKQLESALLATNERLDAFLQEQSMPSSPTPSCSSAIADKEAIQIDTIAYDFDTIGPDAQQDYMPSIIRDEQAKGKLVIIQFQQDFVHGLASPNDLDVPEGTLRQFKNEGVNELFVYMQVTGDRLLHLQPGQQGAIVFRGGAWGKN